MKSFGGLREISGREGSPDTREATGSVGRIELEELFEQLSAAEFFQLSEGLRVELHFFSIRHAST